MMRKIIFPVLLLLSSHSFAQHQSLRNKFLFSAGIENHLPVNEFANVYSYGLGISPSLQYHIADKLAIMGSPAFTIYFYKINSVGVSGSTGFFTLMGGLKYYVYNQAYVVFQGGLGVKISKYGKESSFAYSGGVGTGIARRFDVQLKYLRVGTSTLGPQAVGLRLAYVFTK